MPNQNAIVDNIDSFSPQLALTGIRQRSAPIETVLFSKGESAKLDPNDNRSAVWEAILVALHGEGQPVYVEKDPASENIVNLIRPKTVQVSKITALNSGDLEVEFHVSSARHYLRQSNPDFQALSSELQSALKDKKSVVVTETLTEHEIIDVRNLAVGPGPAFPGNPSGGGTGGPGPTGSAPGLPPGVPPPAAVLTPPPPISLKDAQALFNLVAVTTCSPPLAPPSPCIPFLYPDDGCYARAHKMCQIIIAFMPTAPLGKAWIYGTLLAVTRNHPNLFVNWVYHVAPTVEVTWAGGTELFIIDPSLFSSPVTLASWVGVQNDPAATQATTAPDDYYRPPSGASVLSDPTYTQTNAALAGFRLDLMIRSVGPDGPPPY